MNSYRIIQGDCREQLREVLDSSVHCVVTSPPYFGLRDYGVDGQIGLETVPDCLGWATGERCHECFVCVMREVFAEVRRVLRDDGTCWLNLGDSYANDGKWGGHTGGKHAQGLHGQLVGRNRRYTGLKGKDLCMVPSRVGLALQADGWWVRSMLPWLKANAMPEPVRDRPTMATESVFLLTKRAKYFYDAEAVRRPSTRGYAGSSFTKGKTATIGLGRVSHEPREERPGRSFRTTDLMDLSLGLLHSPEGDPLAFRVNGRPFAGSHFAVFPPELVEPCILAGTSESGCCPGCGAPFQRVIEPTSEYSELLGKDWADYDKDQAEGRGHFDAGGVKSSQRCVKRNAPSVTASYVTKGWAPTCACDLGEPTPCTVLDPFSGAGTTGVVALGLGRHYLGVELNPEYLALSERRIAAEAPLFAQARRAMGVASTDAPVTTDQPPLFTGGDG